MIHDVLYFIKEKLSDSDPIIETLVDVNHINKIIDSTGLVISVVNIEEEATLRNQPISVRINGELKRKNPPEFINIYILFVATHSDYKTALNQLSEVIIFFQNKRLFTATDEDGDDDEDDKNFPKNIEKITIEMYSLKLEELNHLWGILGGVYYPSVLYKVRVLRMEAKTDGEEEKEIKEIEMKTNVI